MRHIVKILPPLFFCLALSVNSYGDVTGRINNVYYTGGVEGETQYQNQAIAFLCSEFTKKYYHSYKGKVFLELDFRNEKNYKLSYDKFQAEFWEHAEENRPAKGNGIRIRLSLSSNRAEAVLKLLEYAINHLSALKKSNKDYYALDYYDRPDELTIDSLDLKEVLETPMNDKVRQTLEIKVLRNLSNSEYKIYKEYYFQNDKYYFTDFLHKDKIYLELKQVYQIISDYYLGTLIFDTDSSGYFYNREKQELSSKFSIKNRLSSSYFTFISTDKIKKRIFFEYDALKGEKMKFIYLTDKFVLLQKVEVYEDELINRELEKMKQK